MSDLSWEWECKGANNLSKFGAVPPTPMIGKGCGVLDPCVSSGKGSLPWNELNFAKAVEKYQSSLEVLFQEQ